MDTPATPQVEAYRATPSAVLAKLHRSSVTKPSYIYSLHQDYFLIVFYFESLAIPEQAPILRNVAWLF